MNDSLQPINNPNIKSLIHFIRDKEIILDNDLAKLYNVETKNLNKAANRNLDRFPEDFRFQLTEKEYKNLMFQNGTSSLIGHGGRRKLPHAYTEQGVSMLSALLRSEIAIETSIKIIRSFVELRHLASENSHLLDRITSLELKQLQTDQNIDQIFTYISQHQEVKEKIFFSGQVYDAHSFLVDLIQKAKSEIILIDNYISKSTLDLLANKHKNVSVKIYTANPLKTQDIQKFNQEYPTLEIFTTNSFHDRFLILDSQTAHLIGASLKDAGKKSFAITKLSDPASIFALLQNLQK